MALAATALGPVQAASAAALPVLSVHSGSAGGFTVSGATSRRAGRVVLNFTNSNAHGSDVQLLHGTTMATVIRHIQAQEGMGAAASTRALTRETHLFGGAGLQAPDQSAQVTETLYSGTYYLLDIAAIFAHKTPTVKALHVYGSPVPRAFPSTAGLISLTMTESHDDGAAGRR